jgi:hypothetical protein
VNGITVNVPGNWTYSPPAGTILPLGNNKTLSVTFLPTDSADYTAATGSATINVLPAPPPSLSYGTRTAVTAKPRSAIFGRPINLTATVKNLSRAGAVPTGSVSFLDGFSNILALQVHLRHGEAILRTSGLPVGRDVIEVHYGGGAGFAPSDSAPVIVIIRARRSKSSLFHDQEPHAVVRMRRLLSHRDFVRELERQREYSPFIDWRHHS